MKMNKAPGKKYGARQNTCDKGGVDELNLTIGETILGHDVGGVQKSREVAEVSPVKRIETS